MKKNRSEDGDCSGRAALKAGNARAAGARFVGCQSSVLIGTHSRPAVHVCVLLQTSPTVRWAPAIVLSAYHARQPTVRVFRALAGLNQSTTLSRIDLRVFNGSLITRTPIDVSTRRAALIPRFKSGDFRVCRSVRRTDRCVAPKVDVAGALKWRVLNALFGMP